MYDNSDISIFKASKSDSVKLSDYMNESEKHYQKIIITVTTKISRICQVPHPI